MAYTNPIDAEDFSYLANRPGNDAIVAPQVVIMTFDEAGKPVVLVRDKEGRHLQIVMADREPED